MVANSDTVGSQGSGRKVSDEFIVPLCRGHHREVHRCGDEVSWWSKTGIDPIGAARTLWTQTHPVRSVAQAPAPLELQSPIINENGDHSTN